MHARAALCAFVVFWGYIALMTAVLMQRFESFMCVIACEWAIVVLCDRVCVVWQTDGATPLYIASQEGHDEVVRALVGAGAAVNQATVCDDLGGRWCSGARGWLVFGLQHARAASCACVCVCVCWVCMAIERCDGHAALRVVPRPLMLRRTR